MPLIDGLEVIGDHPEAVGIELTGTMQAIISRVNVRRCRHGIHLTERNRNTIVTNCHLYENQRVGLYLDDVNLHQINVTGCHISYNGGGGIVVRAGNVRNLHVAGCDLEANMDKDGPPTANVLIDSTGGEYGCAEVAITGCTIQHTANAPGSANVRFIGTDAKDRAWGHVTVTGNVFSDVHVNVDIAHAQNVIVSANTMWKGHDHDIRVVDSADVAIGPNMLGRNPHYRDEDKADGGLLLHSCADVTITGAHIKGTRRTPAGLVLEDCHRVNITGCTMRDCQNAGALLKNCDDCRLGQCMISQPDDATGAWQPVVETGGKGNRIEREPR
jgi:parallel beta-helix repeat protein